MKTQTAGTQTLRESFFDNTFDGVAYCQAVIGVQGKIADFIYLEVNKIFEELTGLKDVVGKKVTELIPGVDVSNPEIFEICGRVALTENPEEFETYIQPLSRWFSFSVYCPKKGYFVTILKDITKQKQIGKDLENAGKATLNVLDDLQVKKDALASAKAKDEAIFASIGDGLLATDEKGNIILTNKIAGKMLGMENQELIGKAISEVVFMEDEKGVSIPLEKRPVSLAIANSITTGGTYYYVRKDKTKFPATTITSPIVLEGKVTGAIQVFRDITQEIRIDKAKTEFVSLSSHQLRTPLTSINWYSEMLSSPDVGSLNEEQKKYIEEIAGASKRMVKLITALLDISRIEFGTFAIEPTPVNIKEITEIYLKELEPEIFKKKLNFTVVYDPSIPTIQADPKLLGMILTNLLTNSVKYTPAGGQIKLAIDKGESEITMAVSDTGLGIPKEK